MRSSSDNLAYPGKEEAAPARHALRIRAPRATARSADPHSSRPRRLVELGVRAWTVAADVLLASLGFVVFIWGDLTTHRWVRVGGIVIVTLAFVAGASDLCSVGCVSYSLVSSWSLPGFPSQRR